MHKATNKKMFVIPLVLALLIGGTGWYYYAQAQESSNGKIEGSGTIEAIELNIGSQLAAEVLEIKAQEGSSVKKGGVLVVLDDRVLKDQVAIAQSGVDAAQAALDDADTSSEKKIAEAQLRQAEANLSMAKIQLAYAAIKSPIDGVVLSLPLSAGEMASPGSTLVVVGKTFELEVVIYIDEKELGRVTAGQKASIKVDAFPGREFVGKVVEIASEAEFTPQNVQTKEQRSNLVFGVTIRIDNTDGMLKPGMPADAIL